MIIDCIADLHGHYPKLDGGDLLIVAGDLTARHTAREAADFHDWLCDQNYKKKIVIGGNHDGFLVGKSACVVRCPVVPTLERFEYLCDSGTEFEGLKIWGSPWTLWFDDINPSCEAFTGTEGELAAKFALIPDGIDILITHGPPYGILDKLDNGEHVGSKELLKRVFEIRPKLHIFGHIHEGRGKYMHMHDALEVGFGNIHPITFINCSHVNEHYKPVNKPIRVIL